MYRNFKKSLHYFSRDIWENEMVSPNGGQKKEGKSKSMPLVNVLSLP